MSPRIRSSRAGCLAVLVTPVLMLGVMAGMAPASAASPLSREPGGRPAADAAALAAVPASLQAAIGRSLGTSVSASGYSQQAELTAAGRAPGGQFGFSVALSAGGGTALVGANQRNAYAGAAYVFTLRGGAWSQTAELTASHAAPNDLFGGSVALSAAGSMALVGASGRNSGAGAAYVFTLRGGAWSQTAELTASHAARSDGFGGSVALSAAGSTALVGGSGAAYMFRLQGGAWSRTAVLAASHAAPHDYFGSPVALSGEGGTALVGAAGRNSDTGAAYLFTLRGGAWSQTAQLTAARAAPNDLFGSSIALSAAGSTALVGASGRNSDTGAAYVFTLHGGAWSQTAELTAAHPARGDGFGDSVALSAGGSTALVGAPGHSGGGPAYVFGRHGGTWSRAAVLAAARAAPNDLFGSSVALSALGSTALVSAPGNNSYTGAAYVFTGHGHA